MKVLFIGGNGNISWWCVQKCINEGIEVYELNRGASRLTRRDVQDDVIQIIADIRDEKNVLRSLGNIHFDVVCDFICFNSEHAKRAIRLFYGRCDQYIVISSEAIYQRRSKYIPFNENTPKYEMDIEDSYIAGKIEIEREFQIAFKDNAFPVTIVRPGYTYDTIIQMPIGQNCFTAPKRLLEGYPLLMPGDGENLVAPLHSRDFAEAFFSLIGNMRTIGESYNIAAEWLITWNEMGEYILEALGLDKSNIVHIPRADALKINDFYSQIVCEQHMWHYIFDVSKIKNIANGWKQTVSFEEGVKETISWLLENPVRQRINKDYDQKLMKLYDIYYPGGIVK
ncbi:NAD-dependent epimerase/dehydratase [Butyrivibrio proteoclasticus B316]|uniref:NAD-dependent epimerase/dehydratase n=1 Tax=Butyrivibrio proteoclasticus (strain ATCC 51982 / DSM 14932 / B316) TaxID=515622 RepID=E0S229_BUTPB|nr:NAD-dependent epimerase/dehydratase family protein [Butyrivibrio proteoclasticus]ADL33854.1 NAD-dependent epimerase/dehydratase [Butyrivibrio proteoclasticus B316]